METKTPRPERDQTDESLRTERKNTDEVMADRRTGIDESADALVTRARQEADAVLNRARDRADHTLHTAESDTQARDAVARTRALEDDRVQTERASADERLLRERAEQASSLAALLPMEREKTDRYLLTERVRSDAALAHRDDFMGMVSHDLRNLLNGIFLNATLLSEQASESEEGRRVVAGMKRIERYVARMNGLIGDLVDVVSIDAGKLAVRPQRADAIALLNEAVSVFELPASAKGIALELEAVESTLPADFDHDRTLQVLANLITNAIKFTDRQGKIVVRGERVEDALRLSVSDTGAGIPDWVDIRDGHGHGASLTMLV
jgi:signal transduction histidine kinase